MFLEGFNKYLFRKMISRDLLHMQVLRFFSENQVAECQIFDRHCAEF
jgi:hypothetical protein